MYNYYFRKIGTTLNVFQLKLRRADWLLCFVSEKASDNYFFVQPQACESLLSAIADGLHIETCKIRQQLGILTWFLLIEKRQALINPVEE